MVVGIRRPYNTNAAFPEDPGAFIGGSATCNGGLDDPHGRNKCERVQEGGRSYASICSVVYTVAVQATERSPT